MNLEEQARQNQQRLAANSYPGRGIVLGRAGDGGALVQVYWIMGRSANSRNRRFVALDGNVRTEALRPWEMKHPELVIYTALESHAGHHIVTNGDHTDTIVKALRAGGDFRAALSTRAHEPDAPHYTPRIAGGFSEPRSGEGALAWLALLKADPADAGHTLRAYYEYEHLPAGYGWCLTTYAGDGDPLPSYAGEPMLLPIQGAPEALADTVWGWLDRDNRVALAIKTVAPGSETAVQVVNARQA